MTKTSQLRVDGQRLWDSIMTMAEIGPGQHGGSCRLALTDEDKQGRDQFVDWCKAIGCSVLIDDMGSIAKIQDTEGNVIGMWEDSK